MRARLVSLAVATPLALATSLALAALLALAATTPALADPGPGDDSGPSHHGSNGPGSGHGGDGSEDGHADGDDDAERRAPSAQGPAGAAEAAPELANPGRHATAPGAGPASTRLSAPEPAPPVGSVAERRPGVAARSTPSDLVGVAGVAGAVLLLAAMVAAGFRARARLGRLG